jgi:hypothetical protein
VRRQGGDVVPAGSNVSEPDTDSAPFGDTMTTDRSVFRIAFVNPGGFPADSRTEKAQKIVEYSKTIEADSLGFVETNMNWSKIEAGCRLHERFHGVWRRCTFNIAHYADYPPKKEPGATAKQWGGVAQCSIDEASSRIHSTGVDPTGLGRWAWTRYQGKEGYGLRVLFAYRCNEKTEHAGSVYNQQKAYFDSIGAPRNPRDAFWEDLISEITPWTESSDTIVLGMDMNDDVRDADNVKHLKALKLTEIITKKHGNNGPNTHEFGSKPIDGLFVSDGILDSKCGYLPFVFDHRLLWMDLDLETTFGYEPDISPRYKPRRLKYDDRRTRERYLTKLSDLLCKESDFADRLETFVSSTHQDVPLTTTQLRYYDSLLREHQAAAQQAEHHCRHLFTGRQAWTPEFTRNRNHRLFWLKMLAKRHGKQVNSRFLQ